MKNSNKKPKNSVSAKIDKEYRKTFLTSKRVSWYSKSLGKVKQITRWPKRKANKMAKFENIITKTSKFVSLVILAAGFLYAWIQLADGSVIMTAGGFLLAVFLIREASK